MSVYLVKCFSTDKTVDEKNPPLSEKGIREAKALRLFLSSVAIDFCFVCPLVSTYASAMLLVGNKVIIDRDERLKKKSTKLVDKQINDFVSFVEKMDPNKNILIVAEPLIVHKLNYKWKESILLN